MAASDPTWTDLFGYRTAVAEWASILALFVSAYAAVTITKVRSQILGRVRLPTLASDIEKKAQSISKLMRDYESSKEQFALELRACEANLKILNLSVRGRIKPTVRALQKNIRKYNGETFVGKMPFVRAPAKSRAEAWAIYTSLNALIEELKHTLEDQRIGG
jgi:hypothetical protein